MHTHLDNGKLLLTYCWIKTELTRAVIPCLVCRPCKLQVENLSGQSWILRAEFLSIKFTSMASRVNLKKKKLNWNIYFNSIWINLDQMVFNSSLTELICTWGQIQWDTLVILSWIYCTLFDFRYVGTVCKALDVLGRFPCPQSERQRSPYRRRHCKVEQPLLFQTRIHTGFQWANHIPKCRCLEAGQPRWTWHGLGIGGQWAVNDLKFCKIGKIKVLSILKKRGWSIVKIQ